MRILVLGGSGMLGHQLWQSFAPRFDTYVSLRGPLAAYARFGLFDPERAVANTSAENFQSMIQAMAVVRPAVVVNCIGIVKQQAAARDPVATITVNALFPHRLAALCQAVGARLIHISTDCVFSGRKGNYAETDPPDAEDLYGRTKYLGEVASAPCLTLRTSMIGPELASSHGLLEWFLSQQGKTVRGYRRAVFSGLTTRVLAELIARLISQHPELEGLWHVAAEGISKCDLLALIRQTYSCPIGIEPDDHLVCDRSLNAERFRHVTGWRAPSWKDMIQQMRSHDRYSLRNGVSHAAG